MRRVLLVSSSTCHPTGYLDHAEAEIRDFLRRAKRVLFLPWAMFDRHAYAAKNRDRFEKMGSKESGAGRIFAW